MRYVGLDLHLESTYGTIMDEDGTIMKEGKFATKKEDFAAFLGDINEAKIAIESTGFSMPWVEFLEEKGFEVFLAHPAKVRIIAEARIKTDKIDSKALAHLLRLDYLPCSYIPPKNIRVLREKVRHRVRLGRMRCEMKNRIKSIINKHRIEINVRPFTLAGREELRDLGMPELDDLLDILESIESKIKNSEKDISLEVESLEDADLLTTIHGIGPYSALLIYSEIGDVNRFPDPEKLCSYGGIVPAVDQSGPRTRRGSITRQGSSLLRWVLIQAVWIHIRHDTYLTRYFHRIVKRKGGNKRARKRAAVATARKMLHVIYAMLRDGKPFDDNYILGGAG